MPVDETPRGSPSVECDFLPHFLPRAHLWDPNI